MLLTSYLGLLNKAKTKWRTTQHHTTIEESLATIGLKTPKIYYVMRDRGNNEVAPTKEVLHAGVGNRKKWTLYKKAYLNHLKSEEAKAWIEKVADESLWQDVVLICYERDPARCHRRLLAHEIARHKAVNYVGELRIAQYGDSPYVKDSAGSGY